MKTAVVILAVVPVVLGALFLKQQQTGQYRLAATQEQLQVASNQLVATTGELVVLRAETRAQSQVITQWTEKVRLLDKDRGQLASQLQQVQEQSQALTHNLQVAEKAGEADKQRLADLQAEQAKLLTRGTALSSELASVKQQLARLEESNSAALADLKVLRQQKTALEMEKQSLEARLHDLDSLRAQIRLIKQEVWQARLAAYKRANAEGLAKGNRGELLHDGQWR